MLKVLVLGLCSSFALGGPLTKPKNANPVPTTVDLGYARYQGVILDAGIKQWLGIRYAASPVGDLRWRAPGDPVSNSTIQAADAFGPVCVGVGQEISDTLNEDCLRINIFSPANATEHSKLPVWFFIQGGGYAGNTDQNFNGTDVILRSGGNIVFAQINYRVGAFGFLASERVRRNGDLNVGILDQRKALHWVQKYIHKFGGDPRHVVIHGDSAGAGSVALHLAANGGRDDHLFVGGVGESVFFPAQMQVHELEFQFNDFVNKSGCANSKDHLACLRSKDLATLQAANTARAPFPGTEGIPNFSYTPCIDGDLLEDYPNRLYQRGKFVRVPVMMGDDTDEGTGFSPNASTSAEVSTFLHNNYPGLTRQDLAIVNRLYPKVAPLPKHAAFFPSAAAAYGEVTFVCPGLLISDEMSSRYSAEKVFNYRYNVLDQQNVENGFGVPHVFEKAAIFGVGMAGAQTGVGSSYETYNANIIPVVMDYWINFVRFLNPNGPRGRSNSVQWEQFEQWGRWERIVLETNNTRMEEVPWEQRLRCEFWNRLTPHTQA